MGGGRGGGTGGGGGRTGDNVIAVAAGCRAVPAVAGAHNGCRASEGRWRWRWRCWPWTSPFYSESCCILTWPLPAELDALPLLGGKLVGMVRDEEKQSFMM